MQPQISTLNRINQSIDRTRQKRTRKRKTRSKKSEWIEKNRTKNHTRSQRQSQTSPQTKGVHPFHPHSPCWSLQINILKSNQTSHRLKRSRRPCSPIDPACHHHGLPLTVWVRFTEMEKNPFLDKAKKSENQHQRSRHISSKAKYKFYQSLLPKSYRPRWFDSWCRPKSNNWEPSDLEIAQPHKSGQKDRYVPNIADPPHYS